MSTLLLSPAPGTCCVLRLVETGLYLTVSTGSSFTLSLTGSFPDVGNIYFTSDYVPTDEADAVNYLNSTVVKDDTGAKNNFVLIGTSIFYPNKGEHFSNGTLNYSTSGARVHSDAFGDAYN